ncbi:hypothetical protein PsorP6_014181 [Peronosclerospora sorghi]|uniref:Uncharacterized protein n=1 Tax=Peronosclerospora sorghi TaxID=230839 RepID=A0ACC0VFI5_9STRA|nr:hypothetical protein PsorP6_014181 [Peronosclerospora sorghi]
MTPTGANMSSRLRRNSLFSDHEDMILLREKLTLIAVGRRHDDLAIDAEADEEKERRRSYSSGSATKHFKAFPSLPLDGRPSTPPSSPQPRDVLRKHLKLKQSKRRESSDMGDEEEERTLPIEDVDAVYSPPSKNHKRSPRGRLSIPGHLRMLSPFSVLTKHPEGLRKRKSIHVDVAEDGRAEQRGSMKKTASQVDILAASAGKLSRSQSVGGHLYQTFGIKPRQEQDHEMEDVECKAQPKAVQKTLFRNKRGQLSACT